MGREVRWFVLAKKAHFKDENKPSGGSVFWHFLERYLFVYTRHNVDFLRHDRVLEMVRFFCMYLSYVWTFFLLSQQGGCITI